MKKPKAPKLITVAILTTITIVTWIFFSVYNVLTKKPPVTVPEEILAPVDPTLNSQALDKLENRIYFEENDVAALPTPTPEEEEPPEEGVVQEEEAQTQTQEATPSSGLEQ